MTLTVFVLLLVVGLALPRVGSRFFPDTKADGFTVPAVLLTAFATMGGVIAFLDYSWKWSLIWACVALIPAMACLWSLGRIR